MKKIDTVVDDIYGLMMSGKAEPTQAYLDHMAKDIVENISRSISDYAKPREGRLRMSNVGRPCKRQLWYESHQYSGEPVDAQTRIKFMFGHIVEALILYLAKESGHSVTDEQREVEVSGIVGHIDCVIDGVLVDVKSASSFAFKKFKENKVEEDDPFGYMGQISGYAKALGLSDAAFLAVDKNSGELCTAKVNPIPDIDVVIEQVKQEVDGDEIPERGYCEVPDGKSGNMALNRLCTYCAFKKHCYPELRAFKYSNGIKYLVDTVRTPDVIELDL